MGKQQRARDARKAAAVAALRREQALRQQALVDASKPPPRGWTGARIAYTAFLWLLWCASLAWPFALEWYAADAPHALLLEAPPYDRDLALVPLFGYALIIALSVRLLFDNFEVASVPVVLGAVFCFMPMESAPRSIELAERVGWRYLGTEKITVRSSEMQHRRYGSWTAIEVDNPRRRGELLAWSAAGEKGEVLCMEVFVGQLGGVWGVAPKQCQ